MFQHAKSGANIMRTIQYTRKTELYDNFVINDFASPLVPALSGLRISINFNVISNLR
jgi:hypothetical protein